MRVSVCVHTHMVVVLKKTHNSRNYQKIWDMFIGLVVWEMFFPTFNCGKFTHTLLVFVLFFVFLSTVKNILQIKMKANFKYGL